MKLFWVIIAIFGLFAVHIRTASAQLALELEIPFFPIAEVEAQVVVTSSPATSASASSSPTGSPSQMPSSSASPSPTPVISIAPSVSPSLLPIGGEASPSPSPTVLASESPTPTEDGSTTPMPTATVTAAPTMTPSPTPATIVTQTDEVARNAYRQLIVPALAAVTMTEADEFYKDAALPRHTAFILSTLAVLSAALGVSLLRGYDPLQLLKQFWEKRIVTVAQRV